VRIRTVWPDTTAALIQLKSSLQVFCDTDIY